MTALHFDPRPTRLATNSATWHLELEPQEVSSLFVSVSCNKAADPKHTRFFPGLLAHRREMRRATLGITSIETSNNIFNEVLCQSMADLNMLMTETPEGRYPYAGIPWYSTTFGRDGLITAMQMLWIDPRVACGVLKRLARYQASAVDPLNDAAPGKILHEMRGGEMAALREVPFAQYYGSVDATPLFVLLAGLYSRAHRRRRDDRGIVAGHRGRAALDRRSRRSRRRRLRRVPARHREGLRNQGWKDSFDAIFHADGALAEGNIALAEVQGYVFAAKRLAARCAQRLGRRELRASAGDRGVPAGAAFRAGVLVRGARHLRAGARRREAALRGALVECRPFAVQRHDPRRPRAPGRSRPVAASISSPAGASAPSRWARPATILCPITTARSGRTTTR